MDSSGKIVWSKHNEVQQANLSKISEEIKDGESISLSTKELGSCEIYPQSLAHSPNGRSVSFMRTIIDLLTYIFRFVVVCGDGEYIIHTALNLRNKSFGQALDFVWSPQGEYAIRESYTKVKIFKNFKERTQVKIDYSAEGIFGGTLLGIKGAGSLNFYSWETTDPIRRIDIEPNLVYWSVNGDRVAVGNFHLY